MKREKLWLSIFSLNCNDLFFCNFCNTIRIFFFFFDNPILVSTGYQISCWDTSNISRNCDSSLMITSKSAWYGPRYWLRLSFRWNVLFLSIFDARIARLVEPRPRRCSRPRTSAKDGRLLIGRQLIKAPYVKLYSILKTSSTSADSEQIQDSEVSINSYLLPGDRYQ